MKEKARTIQEILEQEHIFLTNKAAIYALPEGKYVKLEDAQNFKLLKTETLKQLKGARRKIAKATKLLPKMPGYFSLDTPDASWIEKLRRILTETES